MTKNLLLLLASMKRVCLLGYLTLMIPGSIKRFPTLTLLIKVPILIVLRESVQLMSNIKVPGYHMLFSLVYQRKKRKINLLSALKQLL